MTGPLRIKAILHSARCDKDGAWKLTLEVPSMESPKVAILTQMVETVFDVEFRSDGQDS